MRTDDVVMFEEVLQDEFAREREAAMHKAAAESSVCARCGVDCTRAKS